MQPTTIPRKSKDLIARMRQLMKLRTQELNRINVMGKSFEVSCKRIIRCLDTEIKRMEKKPAKHLGDQAEWSEKQTILKSSPGVSDTLTYSLLPELGSLNNKEIAALVGIAPSIETAVRYEASVTSKEDAPASVPFFI